MKPLYLTVILFALLTISNCAQANQDTTLTTGESIQLGLSQSRNHGEKFMVRVYEDNDFFNDLGKGTDRAYTNGSSIDLFYTKNRPSNFFIDRWMPKAGDNSINTFSLGIMQIMFTPDNLGSEYCQPNDYPYSGALFATHTLYSYNPQKHYDIQTTLLLGVMGPDAFTKQAQRFVHKEIHDQLPNGWDNQYPNDLLLNVKVVAEKELVHVSNYVTVIGGSKLSVGTMMDALELNSTIIVGKMSPHFNGFVSQHSASGEGGKGVQAYFIVKPGVQAVARNSMLEGGMFSKDPQVKVQPPIQDVGQSNLYEAKPSQEIKHIVGYFSYGVEIVFHRVSISYTQSSYSSWIQGVYDHTYGNVTFCYSW